MSPASEFSRMIDVRQIGAAPVTLAANPDECTAVARRFGLVRVDRLEATVTLTPQGEEIAVSGILRAQWVQPCAVSGEDLPQQAQEPITLRFVPETAGSEIGAEEVELTDADCDEIPFSGHSFDIGEAIAQSLALAIDPFAVGPDADKARAAAGIIGEEASGPFAALASLRRDLGDNKA